MKAERSYNKAIYPETVLRRAAKDYSSLGTVDIAEVGNANLCFFSSSLVEPEHMAEEFDNYLIELLNSGEKYADL